MARPATGNVVTRQLANGDTRYSLRFRHNGERAYETLGTDTEGWDRKRAQDALDDRLAQVRLGTYIAPHRGGSVVQDAAMPTFHEFASLWYAAKRGEVASATAEVYLWHLRDHLLPYFQHHRLSDITIAAVEKFRQFKVNERDRMAAARERGERTDHRPLSNETINKLLVRLGQILDAAEERELIVRNPMRVNTKDRKLRVSKPRRSYLDSARQIVALLDAAGELDRAARSDHRHLARRAMFAALVFSGMRLGELLALLWRDVDLADGWLYVGRSKTDAGSGRRIKIRPALRDALLELKAGAGASTDPDALVFGTATGKPHSQSNVRRMMRNAVNRADERLQEIGEVPLPQVSPHSLRRTFASVMFALGESIPDVMADGGWADSKTPLTVYAHAMRREDGENERLRALVWGADIGGLGTSAHSEAAPAKVSPHADSAVSRSTSEV
jgi:integrase